MLHAHGAGKSDHGAIVGAKFETWIINTAICAGGGGIKAFTQAPGSDVMDASCLLMPLLRFIGPTDPRWTSTMDAVLRELVKQREDRGRRWIAQHVTPGHRVSGMHRDVKR